MLIKSFILFLEAPFHPSFATFQLLDVLKQGLRISPNKNESQCNTFILEPNLKKIIQLLPLAFTSSFQVHKIFLLNAFENLKVSWGILRQNIILPAIYNLASLLVVVICYYLNLFFQFMHLYINSKRNNKKFLKLR